MLSLEVDSLGGGDGLDDWLLFDHLDLLGQLGVDLGSSESEGKFLSLGGHTRDLSEHASVNRAEGQG